jgi:hypothetical protein
MEKADEQGVRPIRYTNNIRREVACSKVGAGPGLNLTEIHSYFPMPLCAMPDHGLPRMAIFRTEWSSVGDKSVANQHLSLPIMVRTTINIPQTLRRPGCTAPLHFSVGLACLIAGFAGAAAAQEERTFSVSGVVVDSVSGTPLEYANVFLAQTTLGTSSLRDGRFTFDRVSGGLYELVVSLVGYERKVIPLLVHATHPARLTVRLAPRAVSVAEIRVEVESPKEWHEGLRRFEEAVLGESNPRDCRMQNPEVLNFRVDGTSLIAWTDSLIRIENPFLGYEVTLAVGFFRWGVDEDTGKCVIFPHFVEMASPEAERKEAWERHRREAYEGSLEHFLRAVVHRCTREEGFSMKSGTLTHGFQKPIPEEEIETSPVVGYPFVEWRPPEWIQVEYRGGEWLPNYLHRIGPRVLIDSSGALATPLAFTIEGPWARQRFGDMLPTDALPRAQP